MGELLLCGATGDLGGRIAARLAERRIPFRALVRPRSDTAALRSSGADLRIGDLTDRPSLDRALAGGGAGVTPANANRRSLDGAEGASNAQVDRDGDEALARGI